ncbi:MAG: chloride channel protein, partial [Candidatus Kapabacteria bacterium]|nr:chloride channel protein [Candidatus Kapabacteria bacterium]
FKAIPFYFVFGAFCGVVSAYMVHFTKLVEKLFIKFNSSFRKVFIGALILGLMIFFFPPLYGEGFESLSDLFKGNYNHILEKSFFYQFKNYHITILIFVSSIMLLKVFASSVTIGSGGNGGIIAPSLFTGALAGFVFSYSLQISGIIELKTENFMAVGMAGLLSGVIHAPLTAIFLIAEGTNGYSLMVPLMIVSAMSFLVKRFINPHSIYIMSLVEEGKWNPDDKDKSVLEELNPADFIERDFMVIQPGIKLRYFIDKIAQSKRNLFPVCNKKGYLIGIVLLDDVREFMFTNEMYDAIIVSDLMHEPADYILTEDNFETIMKKFDGCNAWNLPVIDDKKYIGFISKSAIFNQYRNHLQHNSFYE